MKSKILTSIQFNLSFSFSLLFMGFLLANIVGIITNSKNIIFLFVLCIELINCFVYSTSETYETVRRRASTAGRRASTSGRPKVVVEAKKTNRFSQSFFSTKNNYSSFFSTRLNQRLSNLSKFSKGNSSSLFKRPTQATYNQLNKQVDTTWIQKIKEFIITGLNLLKIGFEFGFFIDAFKLGS